MQTPHLGRADDIIEPWIYATWFNTRERNHALMWISSEDLRAQKLSRAFLISWVGWEVSLVMILSVPNGTYINTLTIRNSLKWSMPNIFLDTSILSADQVQQFIESNSTAFTGRDIQSWKKYSIIPSIDWAHEENWEECFRKIAVLYKYSGLIKWVNEATSWMGDLLDSAYNRKMLEYICSSEFYAKTRGELKTQELREEQHQHVREILGSK